MKSLDPVIDSAKITPEKYFFGRIVTIQFNFVWMCSGYFTISRTISGLTN